MFDAFLNYAGDFRIHPTPKFPDSSIKVLVSSSYRIRRVGDIMFNVGDGKIYWCIRIPWRDREPVAESVQRKIGKYFVTNSSTVVGFSFSYPDLGSASMPPVPRRSIGSIETAMMSPFFTNLASVWKYCCKDRWNDAS